MLVDVWQELPSSSKLVDENVKICSYLSQRIVSSLEHVLSFIRLLASKDSEGNFRCAPEGKLVIQQATLFRYAVLSMGLKNGETAYFTMQNIAEKVKTYKMYHLVLVNLFVVIGMADTLKLDHEVAHFRILIDLLKNKLNYMSVSLGILNDCEKLLFAVKNYYKTYTAVEKN